MEKYSFSHVMCLVTPFQDTLSSLEYAHDLFLSVFIVNL